MQRTLLMFRAGAWAAAVTTVINGSAKAGPLEILDECGILIQMAPGCIAFEPNVGGFYVLSDLSGFGVGDAVHVVATVVPSLKPEACPFLSGTADVISIEGCEAAGVYVDDCGTLVDQTGKIPKVVCNRFQSDSGGLFLLWDLGGFEVGDRVHVAGFAHGPCSTFTCGFFTGCMSFNTIESCAADINGDGVVDGLDLGILLANWSIPPGAPGCGGSIPCASDVNDDGVVDGIDLGVVLASWTLPPT